MDQEPRYVAAFVWECMQYRRYEAAAIWYNMHHTWSLKPLGLEYSHVVDTFSSDYEDYFDEMGDDVLITLHYITKWPLPQQGGAPVKGPT